MQKWKLDANLILIDIKYKLPEPRKSHEKLQADLGVSKSVTEIISKQKVMLELESWSSEHYSIGE